MKCPQCGFDLEGWVFENDYEKLCVSCGSVFEEEDYDEPIYDEPLSGRKSVSRFISRLFGRKKEKKLADDLPEDGDDVPEAGIGMEPHIHSDAHMDIDSITEESADAAAVESMTDEVEELMDIEKDTFGSKDNIEPQIYVDKAISTDSPGDLIVVPAVHIEELMDFEEFSYSEERSDFQARTITAEKELPFEKANIIGKFVDTDGTKDRGDNEECTGPDDFLLKQCVSLKMDDTKDDACKLSEREALPPDGHTIDLKTYTGPDASEDFERTSSFEEDISDEGRIDSGAHVDSEEYVGSPERFLNSEKQDETETGVGAAEYLRFKALMPGDVKIYDFKRLGRLLLKEGLYEKAIDVFKKALEIEPDNGEAWGELGGIYYHGPKDFQKAIDCSQRALAIDDELIRTRCILYLALLHDGHYKAAKNGFLGITRMTNNAHGSKEEVKENSEAILLECLNGLYNDRKEASGKLLEEITDIIEMIELERICFH